MRRVFAGTLVRYEQRLKLSWTGNEWSGQEGGCGGCVWVHRYTMNRQSGPARRIILCITWRRPRLARLISQEGH
jgi:hypothetical protein